MDRIRRGPRHQNGRVRMISRKWRTGRGRAVPRKMPLPIPCQLPRPTRGHSNGPVRPGGQTTDSPRQVMRAHSTRVAASGHWMKSRPWETSVAPRASPSGVEACVIVHGSSIREAASIHVDPSRAQGSTASRLSTLLRLSALTFLIGTYAYIYEKTQDRSRDRRCPRHGTGRRILLFYQTLL